MIRTLHPNILIMALALTLGFAGSSPARMTLDTGLLLRGEYHDNIFLDPVQEQEEMITLVAPELHWLLDTPELAADLAYRLEFRYYANDSSADQTAIDEAQRLLANATLFPRRDLTIGILDEYSRVIIDERRPTSEANPFVNRADRNLLEVNPRYRMHPWRTLEAGFGYRYRNLTYANQDQANAEAADDSQSHRLDADLAKQVSQRLRLTAGTGFERFRSDDSGDYDRQDVRLGFHARTSPELTLGGSAGVVWLDFSDRDSTSSSLGELWGEYQWTSRWISRLEFAQDFTDSVDQGVIEDRSAQARLTHADSRNRHELRLFIREARYQEVARKDRSAGVAVSTSRSLGQQLELTLDGFLTSYRFTGNTIGPDNEDVVQVGAGGRLAYRLRIVTAAIGYRYEERESEIDSNDYRNNLIFAEVRADF